MKQRGIAETMLTWLVLLAVPACEDSRLNQGKPRLVVEPEQISFKTLNVGEQDLQTLLVQNAGTASLQIDDLSLGGDGVFAIQAWNDQPLDPSDFPLGLAASSTAQPTQARLQLSFTAQELGLYQGQLLISSNDPERGELTVPLTGKCSVPDIDIAPSRLDFGGVGLNSSSSLALTVSNQGQSDLVITKEQLSLASGASDSPFLWITDDLRLGAGSQALIQVIYAPKEVHLDPQTHEPLPDEDTLLVGSNDPDENPVAIPLTGRVSDNLPPLVTLRLVETRKLDGTVLADPCQVAPSDTVRLEATVIDPEGDFIQPSNLTWTVEQAPGGSQRRPTAVPGEPAATFRPDLYGEYTVCVTASDPQGNESVADPAGACSCQQAAAQAADEFLCPCIHFTAYPREDIRIELVWDTIGPDLDLHLLAPGGDYCQPTRECRFNTNQQDPDWDRFACVESGSTSICRTPNCDPVLAGCQAGQECYDDGQSGPACFWRRCSSRDCYWDSRNPDWGVLGQEEDDPLLAIDCTHSCRAENINLNHPEPGIYRIMVNTFEAAGETRATVRVFFKGDVEPSAEFVSTMGAACDTWNVALLEWSDPENHPVTYLDDSHSQLCCQ